MSWDFAQENDSKPQSQELSLTALVLLRERLWPYIARYQSLFYFSLLLVLLSTTCALITPWLLGLIVDRAFVPKQVALVLPFAMLFFGADLVRIIATAAQNYYLTRLGQLVLHNLRQDLLQKYQFYPVSEFNRTPTGRLVTRLVNDTASLQDLFTGGLAVALGEIVVVIGILLWLIVLNPILGIVCVSVFPLMLFIARFFGKRIHETFKASRNALSRLNAMLAENILGMWIIQLFNRQNDFKQKFTDVSSSYTRAQMATVESFAYFQPMITILASLSMSLLIWWGGYRAIGHHVTLGLLVTFMSYLQALFAPIRDITEKYNLFLSGMASCDRIFEFMDRKSEAGSDFTNSEPTPLKISGRIAFENVFFRYQESKSEDWTLDNVSFVVEPGQTIGIVGHTGAGKTTLSALLMRFYDLQKGRILIDETDISLPTIDRRSVRQAIGYIQQDPFLFTGTVRDNILLWRDFSFESSAKLSPSALQVLKDAGLDPEKEIFEKGANLSSGERQIIAFLRALASDPKILILDEATAHVDSFTEARLTRLSKDAFENRTVLIIAHRLATLKSVDRILVMHHGKLIESGSHHELLAHGEGLYRKLYEIQSRREQLQVTRGLQ